MSMENMSSDVKSITEKVREDFEQKRIPRDELVRLYSEYNPKIDASVFVAEAEKVFPKLNCGLASVYLQNILGDGKIVRGSYEGNDHTFLLLNDDTIVDITADQYGGPEVYVGKLKTPWSTKN